MLVSNWNRTNQAFKQRIDQSQEADTQLKSKLGMIQKEMKDQNNYIDKIKAGTMKFQPYPSPFIPVMSWLLVQVANMDNKVFVTF